MIVDITKLSDFKSGHTNIAEGWVQDLICSKFNLAKGPCKTGKFPDYDFIIENTKIELKFCSNDWQKTPVEIAYTNKQPSGLMLTKSDLYAFFNQDYPGSARLRLIRTSQLIDYVHKNQDEVYANQYGYVVDFDLSKPHFNDLGLGSCSYKLGKFDLSTFRTNSFAQTNIRKFIT